jgi:predicted negative regulator of RcsB-dependent stress response
MKVKISCLSRLQHPGFASTDSAAPSVEDPTEHTAMEAMQEGNKRLEEGDVQGARDQYAKSVEIKPTASACFNLGVSR